MLPLRQIGNRENRPFHKCIDIFIRHKNFQLSAFMLTKLQNMNVSFSEVSLRMKYKKYSEFKTLSRSL